MSEMLAPGAPPRLAARRAIAGSAVAAVAFVCFAEVSTQDIATTLAVRRTSRRPTSASARLGTSRVATSDDIVTVEGNAYFPLSSVPDGVLRPSNTTSVCPWRGIASYYDVHVDGQVVPDGAFTYRHPSPLARRIKGRVAFWNGIEVDTSGTGKN